MVTMGTSLKPDGSFLFSNVSPGDYRIQVQHHSECGRRVVLSRRRSRIGIGLRVTHRDRKRHHRPHDRDAARRHGVRSGHLRGAAKPPIAPAAL